MPYRRWQFALLPLVSGCFVGSQVLVQTALAQAQTTEMPPTSEVRWIGPVRDTGSSWYPSAQEACGSHHDVVPGKPIPPYGSTIFAACDWRYGDGGFPTQAFCEFGYPYVYLGDTNGGVCVHGSVINKVIADNGGYVDTPLVGGAAIPLWYALWGLLSAAGIIAASPPQLPNLPSDTTPPVEEEPVPDQPVDTVPELPENYTGNNPTPGSGNRTNTDLKGGAEAAVKKFEELTGGNYAQEGDQLVGKNGIRLRVGDDGRYRLDIPASGNRPHETVHYNN